MPKKGGKKKNKGGAKPTAAAAATVNKVADGAKDVVYVELVVAWPRVTSARTWLIVFQETGTRGGGQVDVRGWHDRGEDRGARRDQA